MIAEDTLLEKKILLVDDEQELLNLLSDVLKREGFKNIYTATTGVDALLNSKDINPDIILLDVNLPDIDGFMVCDKIRNFSFCPIIFLTAKGDDDDKLNGLGAGGDDYVTKPFNIKEVVLRVKAQLRRNSYIPSVEDTKGKIISFSNIVINEDTGEVTKSKEAVILTAKEYQLLLFLAKNPNKIFSKSSLCSNIWGFDYDGYDNTIMVHIRHLREKLEDNPSSPNHIKTMKGLGYKLVIK
ncbi:DNA-binding response regulator, OmpR family, contains REC and winged-helix (wHTH) domain [Clostridium cavendishii DSM 21758]|uniref:Stage 0 sporulation protein A homolog n=1 Tax=Clostridium cavendishii DSM 21758 TaxID=1121302 RepID=A0A1M6IT74_9CLOT|nr:response regulator transcription factor [Clostridium cavendishii]SHJ37652.1 DNA-binding response regulator, OmpR family, contains REC and winged-helix (wHTH) domain [Clostridium cavendishii DSM 21758]